MENDYASINPISLPNEGQKNDIYLIVRSLKNKEGN